MKIDATQGDMVYPLMPSAAASGPEGIFAAMLEATKRNSTHASDTRMADSKASAPEKTALQELEEYLRKSPVQRLRDAILKEMGLTEEALNAMPPKQRAAVENAIAAKMKEYMLGHNNNPQQSGKPDVSPVSMVV